MENGVSSSNGPVLATGSRLAVWDRERRAYRAVLDDEAELARMQNDVVTTKTGGGYETIGQLRAVIDEVNQDREARLVIIREQGALIDSLTHERNALLARLDGQAEIIIHLKDEMESLRTFSAIARGVMVDILGSPAYRLIRLLGRWGSLERRIHRSLR